MSALTSLKNALNEQGEQLPRCPECDFHVLLDLKWKLAYLEYDRLPLKNLTKLRLEVDGLVERAIASDSKRMVQP